MTSKKYLSEKKTAQQTISISPALKDWIERYVNVNRKNFPKDKRFKSISAFYNYVMEKSMEIFNRGKTLNDFAKFVDQQTENFFEKLTFKAVIPFHEEIVRTHRYNDLSFRHAANFLFAIRKVYLDGIEPYDYNKFQEKFNILRNFYLENKIAKEIRLEISSDGDTKNPKGIFECIGNYRNLFWENCKMNAAVLGIIGVKITKVIYSEKELYCRFNLKATDLIFRKDLARKQRIELVNYNVNLLLNYFEVINDNDDFYLWMKLAEDKGIYIKFNNNKTRNRWIDLIISEIEKHGESDDIILHILKFFQKIHWIEIEDESLFSFKISLSEENDINELNYLLSLLSKYSHIDKIEGKYYLDKKAKI